ncbi:MAG: efflux RND transporter permease subunit [Proteobacteria bacterium]|nr:efflux RND transporter permease subunit [Pseudomonadota bacterium]
MKFLVHKAIEYSSTIWLVLVGIILAGVIGYVSIAKESNPDVPIPLIFVSVHYDGISPEDGVNLLLKPLENELKGISGLDKMQSQAFQGGVSVKLKFTAGFDNEKALTDVREAVDTAKAELPVDADEPIVKEINVATFPIVSVVLVGDASERRLTEVADLLQEKLEGISTVLEAEIQGKRESQILIEVDKNTLESYSINPMELINIINNNNKLVAVGKLETSSSSYAIKVPGLLKNQKDVLELPIYSDGDKVLKFKDIAHIKLSFKDPVTITRFNGKPAIVIEISKRIGENIIETVDAVKALLKENEHNLPDTVTYEVINDESEETRDMLSDLQNNVLASILLVMIIILAILGYRLSLLVAISIPGSFLIALILLYSLGYTLNIIVLFALILSVGMLVDGAIVVVEMADNFMREGFSRKEAFKKASVTVVWPITASTATTLAVFFPLLFWPGMVGEFMKFLPITLIFTLTGSLMMAVVFIPVLGSKLAKKQKLEKSEIETKLENKYENILRYAVERPTRIILWTILCFVSIIMIYAKLNHGTEFFPDTEPEQASVMVRAKGDWSIYEKDEMLKKVENLIIKEKGIENVYSVVGVGGSGTGSAQDIIGRVSIEFIDWEDGRDKADIILEKIKRKTEHLYGIRLETEKQQGGPKESKPINIAIKGDDYNIVKQIAKTLTKKIEVIEGIDNLANSLPDDGIEWSLLIDREESSINDTSLVEVGNTARLATTGVKVGSYRPDDSNDEYDIVARFKESERSLSSLDELRIISQSGNLIPAANLMEKRQKHKIDTIDRLDQKTVVYIKSGVKEGFLANSIINIIQAKIKKLNIPYGVSVEFQGDRKDQQDSAAFLQKAFLFAVLLMLTILVTQFNNFYQAFVILSAVVLSIGGVLIGHLIMFKPFGIVMSGIGVIALAGIVVNNNIVLIDAYNLLRDEGQAWKEALVNACKTRLRPVLLTAITTLVGLLPMALKMTILFTERTILYNTPSSQMWDQLASSIAFGLTFATVLTLIVTPSLIAWNEIRKNSKTKITLNKTGMMKWLKR